MDESILTRRAAYSEERVTKLSGRVEQVVEDLSIDSLAIFCAGSLARLEASEHSDLDLFFIYDDSHGSPRDRRTKELKLFGRLIDVAEDDDFPGFSNDSEYLKTANVSDLLDKMGGPTDDSLNFFTLRMLMLLESRPVAGASVYEDVLRQIIGAYYRDYPGNEHEFEPWFLLNDIMRFWKTLLLNYENKRSRRGKGEDIATPQRVRNFKLKFSRMTTCFATVAAMGSAGSPVTEDDVFELATMTPQARLRRAAANLPELSEGVDDLLIEYGWFIEMTGLPEADLHAKFEETEGRRQMFARASAFGTSMWQLLNEIDKRRPDSMFMRHLVI